MDSDLFWRYLFLKRLLFYEKHEWNVFSFVEQLQTAAPKTTCTNVWKLCGVWCMYFTLYGGVTVPSVWDMRAYCATPCIKHATVYISRLAFKGKIKNETTCFKNFGLYFGSHCKKHLTQTCDHKHVLCVFNLILILTLFCIDCKALVNN